MKQRINYEWRRGIRNGCVGHGGERGSDMEVEAVAEVRGNRYSYM